MEDIKRMFQLKADVKISYSKSLESKMFQDTFITDALKIRIILINLIGNAIKFTDSGSIIVRLSATGKENNKFILQVEVEDTGFGISEEEIHKLFNFFLKQKVERKVSPEPIPRSCH